MDNCRSYGEVLWVLWDQIALINIPHVNASDCDCEVAKSPSNAVAGMRRQSVTKTNELQTCIFVGRT